MITTRAISTAGIILLLQALPAAGQASAERATPVGRGHHTIFYDEARQRVMLTGGATSLEQRRYEMHDDLWSFDGVRWTALPRSGQRMSGARVAIDSRNRAYSFGGWREASVGDLRVLDGDRWRDLGTHPSIVVAEGGFVFDAARHRFVAFGGDSPDVWEYDGASWSKHAATPPPARGAHAMVYDAQRRRTVVFGGQGVRRAGRNGSMLGDTWEFDGTRWTQMQVQGPSPRLGAGAAYDSKRGLMIVFGGANEQGDLNDLWAWNGTSWRKLAEGGPDARVMGFIAYDKRRDRIVLFGGRHGYADLSDTWEWDGEAWKQVTP